MVLAAGRWAWWNQYGSVPIDECARRALEARLDGVIVKWGYNEARSAFAAAQIPWATERYVYPAQPELEAQRLAQDIGHGARFAVINAEIEWEALGPEPMERLIAEFRRLQPTAEIYACVDTRGNRLSLPYQRLLAEHLAGWMPMVYPGAFAQTPARAFAAALDDKDFHGKPVMPAIQTYGGVGAAAVAEQLAEVHRRGLPGYQAYTVAHATDDEWRIITNDAPEEEDMSAIETLQRTNAVAALFLQAAGYALRGAALPDGLRDQLRYLLNAR